VGLLISPRRTENAILAVLSGTPLEEAAASIETGPTGLADAIELYQAAGRAALEVRARAGDWQHVSIEFPDWDTAEHAAVAGLAPRLRQAEQDGIIAAWWFIRKAPCWRLRCLPGPAAPPSAAARISGILQDMRSQGLIVTAQPAIYEPETCAFGGPNGMDTAHRLFHADSRNILAYLAAPPAATPGRRELSVLLCSRMFRGARQDWYEQGDIWHQVAVHRPVPPGTPLDRLSDLTPGLRQLMSADTGSDSTLTGTSGPLAFASGWAAAFEHAGTALADAARDGTLTRGLRAVLAHHVIFHWNRIGLPSRTQAILAAAATQTVFGT
jgi:thiopeptide-type bacteriocin biosynthesis protein